MTRPCPYCGSPIVAVCPSRAAKKQTCGANACRSAWHKDHLLPREVYAAMGSKGGHASKHVRRALALMAVVERVRPYLRRLGVTETSEAWNVAWRVGAACYRQGYRVGVKQAGKVRWRARRKAAA